MPTTMDAKKSAIPHLEPETFVGMSYGDAKLLIEGAGYTCKTALTAKKFSFRYMKDYDPLTINLVVDDNLVTAAFRG